MKQSSKCRLIASATALALVSAATAMAAGTPVPLGVNVVNTPLPVTGSVSLSGSGNVSAAQSGNWSVGINNGAANPVPVRNVEQVPDDPFQFHVCISSGAQDFSCATRIIVPATVGDSQVRRMTIEHVTAFCTAQPSTEANLGVQLATTSGGTIVTHGFPLNAGTVSNVLGTLERDQGLAQVTRLYADPGTEVFYGSSSTGITGGRCDITISGVYALQ